MRKVMRWRFYCEHCKKSGASRGAMAKHEKHCTLNPSRECRMCALAGDVVQQPMADLIAAFDAGGQEALRKLAENCPVCIFATLRQHRAANPPPADYEAAHAYWERYNYDFKAESESYLREVVDANNEANYAY